MPQPSISSFLWFDAHAEEAVRFYASVFGEHCRTSGTRFELFGQRYIAFNGGSQHKLSYWDALLQGGGTPSRCGWLRDRFGLSWQVIPRKLFGLLNHPDKDKASRALKAMLTMQKLDLAALESA
jgi:predicted 3-demethylubiquinone-9 3-methyltransferase (glyoxalase superfamily)